MPEKDKLHCGVKGKNYIVDSFLAIKLCILKVLSLQVNTETLMIFKCHMTIKLYSHQT